MSLPPPVTVHELPDWFWLPAAGATLPMSAQVHVLGQMPGGCISPGATATVFSVTASAVP